MENSGQIGQFSPQKGDINAFKKQQILRSLANGVKVAPACRAASVGRSTFYEWYNKDPEFAREVDAAEWDTIASVEGFLFQACAALDTTAMIFFLCNRDPNRWQRKPAPRTEDVFERARQIMNVLDEMDQVTENATGLIEASRSLDSDHGEGGQTS